MKLRSAVDAGALLLALVVAFTARPVSADMGSSRNSTRLPSRRDLLRGMAALPFARSALAAAIPDRVRIAFGSCNLQDHPQPVWRAIAAAHPDVFVFLGDNIYGDTEDMRVLAAKYRQLMTNPDFARFRRRVPVVATWDDHDYGANDAGREYPMKRQSKALFLDAFGEPAKSERRLRDDGIYTSYLLGQGAHRLQLVLLDMRYNRSPLTLEGPNSDTYLRDDSPEATFLGARQWRWLEGQLAIPAAARLIGSSIQFVGSDHRYEKWANFPREKRRMVELVDRLRPKNAHVISGDVHFGELSGVRTPGGIDLVDFSSSGLNHFESAELFPNSRRFALYDRGPNFGLVTADWSAGELHFELRTAEGATAFHHRQPLK